MAVLRDLPASRASSSPIYSVFPVGQIEQGLSVRILEPGYSLEHAPAFLLGAGVDKAGALDRALDVGRTPARRQREAKVAQLLELPLILGTYCVLIDLHSRS